MVTSCELAVVAGSHDLAMVARSHDLSLTGWMWLLRSFHTDDLPRPITSSEPPPFLNLEVITVARSHDLSL